MSKKGFGKFLAGASIGAALGLLFAPKKGSEMRKELKDKFDELVERARDIDADEVKMKIETQVALIKDELANLDKEKVLKIAKKKAKEITEMANQLVDFAIEKGTPVLEKAASQARLKAIEVTKDILNKLEKEEK